MQKRDFNFIEVTLLYVFSAINMLPAAERLF